MFELENEITRWKRAVASDGVVGRKETSELESHLRETVASLNEAGLTTEEAFMVGTHRLGEPFVLQNEYAKNNLSARWRQPVFWMLAGHLGIWGIGKMVSALGTTAGAAMAFGGFGGAASGLAMVALMAMAWSLIFFIAFRGRQQFGSMTDSLPMKWMFTIGATLFIAPAINMVGHAVPASLVSAAWYGEAAIYLSIGGVALNFCILTFCFVALCKLNDRSAWNLG